MQKKKKLFGYIAHCLLNKEKKCTSIKKLLLIVINHKGFGSYFECESLSKTATTKL